MFTIFNSNLLSILLNYFQFLEQKYKKIPNSTKEFPPSAFFGNFHERKHHNTHHPEAFSSPPPFNNNSISQSISWYEICWLCEQEESFEMLLLCILCWKLEKEGTFFFLTCSPIKRKSTNKSGRKRRRRSSLQEATTVLFFFFLFC